MSKSAQSRSLVAVAVLSVAGFVIFLACQDRSDRTVREQSARVRESTVPPTESRPEHAAEPESPLAEAPEAPPEQPARPEPTWAVFREAFEDKRDARCEVAWLGENRFNIETENIQRLTLDFTELPPGAPEKGPWIVTLDGQTIEFTGFKPRAGYTGLKRDVIRSPNGVWEVDRKRLYRPGE